MRRAAWRDTVVLALALGSAATACSSANGGEQAVTPRPSVATAPERTTTTNPYAVPPVIDAAYVNRVLAGLDAAVGDVVRMVVQEDKLGDEFVRRLRTIYDDQAIKLQFEIFAHDAQAHFKGYRPSPGDQVSRVTELVTATPGCIFAHISRDYAAVTAHPNPELSDQWVGLLPLDAARDPEGMNPTGWSYRYDGFEESHAQPRNPCAA